MAQLPTAPQTYRAAVQAQIRTLAQYWVPGPPGLYSAAPGRPDAFYDDNEWIGLDLVAASRLLRRPELLARAGAIFGLVATGWSRADAACPGGVYWQRTPPGTDRAAVTTANGALLALEFYRATGRRDYVMRAHQMVVWLQECLQRPDGLIANDIDGEQKNDRAWSYNQGATIADLVLLAQITGRPGYLADARRIAAASLAAYGTSFAGEPRAFVAIFFRDLALLDAVTPSPRYRRALQAYADREWRSGRDRTTDLFGTDLLDQAGMVQIYAQLAAEGG
jgi:predicted alpha-1,6-mannanase (GH76 family)